MHTGTCLISRLVPGGCGSIVVNNAKFESDCDRIRRARPGPSKQPRICHHYLVSSALSAGSCSAAVAFGKPYIQVHLQAIGATIVISESHALL